MVWRQTLIICTFVVSFVRIQQVACSGVFELRLKSFINEKGRDDAGQCCSGERNGLCEGTCRTRFRVCLKHFQNKIDTKSACTFGDVRTPVLGDNNVNLTDGPDIRGYNKTIRFPFDFSWPGTFSLIIEAWHDTNDTTSGNTSAVDAGVTSKTSSGGINFGHNRLISQFAMQQELKVSPLWTQQEHKSKNATVAFEFRATCDEHYYGSGCANLCRPRDDGFGHYTCSPIGKIDCLPGWNGDYCTKPVCLRGCDETHGYCSKPGECSCHSGWKGRLCDECERYPGCLHGTCQRPWDCLCVEGWGGLFCNQDLNYCTNHKPCRNGGTCFNTGQGSYTCSCPPGYTGADCDRKLSDCSHKPCLNGATCKENGTSYQCECSKGWYGTHCELAVQTCENKPCKNGGTCMDTIHGYKCSCPLGYVGQECQEYVDHCAKNPCSNGGNCSALSNNSGFRCSCPSGFTGRTCQTNVDDCHGNPCRNGGSCIDLVNNYRCQCVPGFVGNHCEEKVDVCLTKPCANGGTCENLVNDYKCRCRPGFSGRDCSIDLDECSSNPCQNGGTCYNRGSGFQCECASGYGGPFCQDENGSNAVSTAIVGNISRHVSVASADTVNDLIRIDWYLIVLVSVAVPTLVLIAVLMVRCSKQRREREQKMADEEARMQNEQNSVHSSATKRGGDAHMIKNVWGQCAKNVDIDHPDSYYPKPVYAAVPADPNIAPVYSLQRSRSQKQLNVDPPAQRHSVCNRVSVKDLDNIIRTSTPAPLDNRLSTVSISISHSNLSDSSLSKQHCSQLLEKDKSVQQNNTLNSSVLNGSMCGSSNGGNAGAVNAYVNVLDGGSFTSTLFATEV